MKHLIIKMSAIGDLIHLFPAITDVWRKRGEKFDWIVYKNFASLVGLHPAIDCVIPVGLKYRKLSDAFGYEGVAWTYKRVRKESYKNCFDLQGNIKSALVTYCCRGHRVGYTKEAMREGAGHIAYQTKIPSTETHIINKHRAFFGSFFGYDYRELPLSFGIEKEHVEADNCIILIPNASWRSKLWPEKYWRELAKKISERGISIALPQGSDEEVIRAKRVIEGIENATLLPKMDFEGLATFFVKARMVIGLDTGLTHLAQALDIPTLLLLGPNKIEYIGIMQGRGTTLTVNHLCRCSEKRICTQDKKNFCLSKLKVDEVLKHITSVNKPS